MIDGDTLKLSIDLGLDVWIGVKARLAGLDCRALGTTEGDQAASFVSMWVHQHVDTVTGLVGIRTDKDRAEMYGRYLATLFDLRPTAEPTLNDLLLSNGLAKSWDGRGPHPW